MSLSRQQLWERFQRYYAEFPTIGLAIDLSRMNFGDGYFDSMESRIQDAFLAMSELEGGAIANPDEKRMVGHYWLRAPALAPNAEIRQVIEDTLISTRRFSAQVHQGTIRGQRGVFKNLLVIGIGGSALGPQFVANALGRPAHDRLKPYFFDNTDPDGMDRVLGAIGDELGQTLCVVISKSGGTKETRNGMLEAAEAYSKAGLNFNEHVVAVTGIGSKLDEFAEKQKWLMRFPMWEWVGGRTSELSAVGLLPAALQGLDIDGMLEGARTCDEITRRRNVLENPAAQLALMWYHAGDGKGRKDMVILPYKDRLELFSKYLQQLVMESLGKELDRGGRKVNQGIAVYGNKGSTDQHAYVQQLRDGINNFFVTFIEVLKDREEGQFMVEPNITSGDYLSGFLLGTREALYENDRESITLTVRDVSPFTVGVLIALYERAVGLYASLVNINAYHQPGVEAGKIAATAVLAIQVKILNVLAKNPGRPVTSSEIAKDLAASEEVETVFKVCEHLAANPIHRVIKKLGKGPADSAYLRE